MNAPWIPVAMCVVMVLCLLWGGLKHRKDMGL